MNNFIPMLNQLASFWLTHIYAVSIQTAALFLFVFLISRIFRKAPAIFLYYLWGIVLLRFLFFGTIRIPEVFRGIVGLPPITQVFQFASIAIEPGMATASPHLALPTALFLLWLGGIVTLSVKLYHNEKRFYRSMDDCTEIDISEKLKPLLATAGVHRAVRLMTGNSVPAPFVIGIFKPVIYLPSGITIGPEERLRNTLMHEIAHIKRHDIAVIALQNILSVIYFFNPIIWLVALQLNSQREKACDDFALIKLNEDTKNYGKSLLFSLENGLRQRRYPVMANGMFFPRNIIIKRFEYLYQKRRKIMLSLKPYQKMVLVVVGIVALILACDSNSKQPVGSASQKVVNESSKKPEIIENPLGAEFIPYDSPPEPIGGFAAIQKNVVYPTAAYKAGVEGTTIIQAKVDENGDIEEAVVLRSSGNEELDAAALAAIKKTKFKPAYQKEKPVGVYISIPVNFKLNPSKS